MAHARFAWTSAEAALADQAALTKQQKGSASDVLVRVHNQGLQNGKRRCALTSTNLETKLPLRVGLTTLQHGDAGGRFQTLRVRAEFIRQDFDLIVPRHGVEHRRAGSGPYIVALLR